ncbi:hypothetical protein BJY04DRAFT_186076 [Aspergillus karnatakaensis]|uniref:uncharacterized protein n=1 Tax=Aspergillus karnatakaensis TaxID=1810916 RepID=UPI003CCCF6D5
MHGYPLADGSYRPQPQRAVRIRLLWRPKYMLFMTGLDRAPMGNWRIDAWPQALVESIVQTTWHVSFIWLMPHECPHPIAHALVMNWNYQSTV